MVEVQISVNDLMAAFSAENAALSQRAILAEQRAKAWQERAEALEKIVESMTPEPEGDDPVAAVVPGPVRGKTRPAKKAAPATQ